MGPAYMSILDKRFLDHLRISMQGQILLEAIEIIPLDEEQTLNPDEIKKHMEEKWQKTEAERESLDKGLKVTGGSEKKKKIRKLLFDKSD